MSASTDPTDAQLDRIMEMSLEELAASEGKTVEQILEEGRKFRDEMVARLSKRFPEFAKKVRS